MAKAAAMEYLGGLKFQAQDYDLASIPDNDRAAAAAASMMFYMRMAALFLRESDAELEAKVRASDGPDEWITLLEGIVTALDAKRQDVELLEAGYLRLLVVLERTCAPGRPAANHKRRTKSSRSPAKQ